MPVRTIKDTTGADVSIESLRDKTKITDLTGKDVVLGAVDDTGAIVAIAPSAIAPKPMWRKITTFLNGWTKTAGQPELSVCKLPSGQVLIQGTINGGTLDAGNFQTPAFTVPAEYRPVTEPFWLFPVVGNLSVSPIPQGVTVVFPNGNVHIIAPNNAAIVFPCTGDRSFF